MVMDLLREAGIPYISENDINRSKYLLELFGGLTPDLIIKSTPLRDRPTILDIYVGRSDSEFQKKKSKYNSLGSIFKVECIGPASIPKVLKDTFLPKERVDYLQKHFNIFLTEHQYWKACIKLRKVLLNDRENFEIKTMQFNDEFLVNQSLFQSKLESIAEINLNRDGL